MPAAPAWRASPSPDTSSTQPEPVAGEPGAAEQHQHEQQTIPAQLLLGSTSHGDLLGLLRTTRTALVRVLGVVSRLGVALVGQRDLAVLHVDQRAAAVLERAE